MTSQFSQKVSIQIASEAPEEKVRGNNIDFAFKEGQLLKKTQVHFLSSPLPYSGASNLGKILANFSGEIVTSRQF